MDWWVQSDAATAAPAATIDGDGGSAAKDAGPASDTGPPPVGGSGGGGTGGGTSGGGGGKSTLVRQSVPPQGKLYVTIVNDDGGEQKFLVRRAKPLRKLMRTYEKTRQAYKLKLDYYYSGALVDGSSTPEQLGMLNEDFVNAVVPGKYRRAAPQPQPVAQSAAGADAGAADIPDAEARKLLDELMPPSDAATLASVYAEAPVSAAEGTSAGAPVYTGPTVAALGYGYVVYTVCDNSGGEQKFQMKESTPFRQLYRRYARHSRRAPDSFLLCHRGVPLEPHRTAEALGFKDEALLNVEPAAPAEAAAAEAKKRTYVYLELGTGKLVAERRSEGRVVIELFTHTAPRAAENFRALCTGERGMGAKSGRPLHYKGTRMHLVKKGEYVQGGDVVHDDGSGGEAVHDGGEFANEGFAYQHSRAGLVGCARPHGDLYSGVANTSLFYITLSVLPEMNNKSVIFGRVVAGMDIVERLAAAPGVPVTHKSRAYTVPATDWVVMDCDETTHVPAPADEMLGDSLPEWPEDAVALLGDRMREKVRAASAIKDVGNQYFRARNFARALAKYDKALRYLEDCMYASFTLAVPLAKVLLQNRANARLRLGGGGEEAAIADLKRVIAIERREHEDAIQEAAVARMNAKERRLEATPPPYECANAKVLYLLGQAYLAIDHVDQAHHYLSLAARRRPKDARIRTDLGRVYRRLERRKAKKKNAYSRLFERDANAGVVDLGER